MVYVYDLPQWFHVFATSYIYIYTLSSIVKDATTFEIELCGCKQATAHAHLQPHGVCVIELWTHQKFESFKKYNFRDDEIRIRIC